MLQFQSSLRPKRASQSTRAHGGQAQGTARKRRLRAARRNGTLASARKPGWEPAKLRPMTVHEIAWERAVADSRRINY